MDETKVLEKALKNCENLEKSLYESIKLVRRLNIRYNSDWLLKNYTNYMANIWVQYRCSSPVKRHLPAAAGQHTKPAKLKTSNAATVLGPRSSLELCGSNRKINYKFIKIKRSMEAAMLQIQRAIDIANRQRNYVHLNENGRDGRGRLCCH